MTAVLRWAGEGREPQSRERGEGDAHDNEGGSSSPPPTSRRHERHHGTHVDDARGRVLRWDDVLFGRSSLRTRPQAGALLIEPALGRVAVTRWTVAMATGVIHVALPRTVITLRDVASEVRRAALLEIPHGPGVTGQHVITDLRAIRRTVEAENVRHLQHADLW